MPDNDLGQVGSAFIEISAKANKTKIADGIKQAQDAAAAEIRRAVAAGTHVGGGLAEYFGGAQFGTKGVSGISTPRQVDAIARQMMRERAAADDAWRLGRRRQGRAEMNAAGDLLAGRAGRDADYNARMQRPEEQLKFLGSAGGRAYLQDKIARDEVARDAKKQMSFLRQEAAGDKFGASLGRLNYAVEKSALPGLARFIPSTVGGAALGIAGGAAGALALGAYKLNSDWAGYRKDVGLSNPVTAFWAAQGERDASAIRGRMVEPGVREQTRIERENTNAREFWRQERAAGRSVPLMARMEQDWASLASDWAKAKSSFANLFLRSDDPRMKNINTLGAGSFEQLGQHLGGYMGVYESAQTAASQSPIGALDENTKALKDLTAAIDPDTGRRARNPGLPDQVFDAEKDFMRDIGPR